MEARAGSVRHADRNGVAFELGRPAGHVMEQVSGQWHVRNPRHRAWFAVVHGFQFGQFVGVFEDEVADFPDQLAALARRQLRPRTGFECLPGGGYCPIDILAITVRNTRDHRSIGGIENVELLAGSGGHPIAGNQVAFRLLQPARHLRADCGSLPISFGAMSVTAAVSTGRGPKVAAVGQS